MTARVGQSRATGSPPARNGSWKSARGIGFFSAQSSTLNRQTRNSPRLSRSFSTSPLVPSPAVSRTFSAPSSMASSFAFRSASSLSSCAVGILSTFTSVTSLVHRSMRNERVPFSTIRLLTSCRCRRTATVPSGPSSPSFSHSRSTQSRRLLVLKNFITFSGARCRPTPSAEAPPPPPRFASPRFPFLRLPSSSSLDHPSSSAARAFSASAFSSLLIPTLGSTSAPMTDMAGRSPGLSRPLLISSSVC
mmetsp:Transcript_2974/g.12181  ORF Transcript_2974/g.12181 Transcript_2974/m.12181 type:complete len:248 (-) Transcript_2974:178-921(-)